MLMLFLQGIQYLENAGFIERTPESIARFFKDNAETLDKVQIGVYFSKGYVDQINATAS